MRSPLFTARLKPTTIECGVSFSTRYNLTMALICPRLRKSRYNDLAVSDALFSNFVLAFQPPKACGLGASAVI